MRKKLLILLDFLLSDSPVCLCRGLRSKKIKRIEHNLAINIKETQKKIWNGVQKDVGYIRKILNEVYFLKFKVRS
jgi:bacterioferritin-associated ferredoxin